MQSRRPSRSFGRSLRSLLFLPFLGSLVFIAPTQARISKQSFPIVPATTNTTRVGFGVAAATTPPYQVAPNHILVKLAPNANVPQFLNAASAQGLRNKGRVLRTNWVRLAIPAKGNPRALAARARNLPGVMFAAADPIVRINDHRIPRDPFYKDDDDPVNEPCDPTVDENCDPLLLTDQWGLFQVGAEGGWHQNIGSPSVVIAVTDSGMDLDHDDLYGNVWNNPNETANGIDDDGNGLVDDLHGADFCGNNVGDPFGDDVSSKDGSPDVPMGGVWVEDPFALFGVRFEGDPAVGDADDNNFDFVPDGGVFHGTFTSGIAGAMTDNINPATGQYEGMAGAAWTCKLMHVRMINAEGIGYGSDAAEAIRYASDNGAHVINCSWGISLPQEDPAAIAEIEVIRDAIIYAHGRGTIVVCAAGNGGAPGPIPTGLDFPAVMKETISVGSSEWNDRRSEFSSSAFPGEIPDNGVDDDGNGWVDDTLDVIAPGELIWSTYVFSAYDALLYNLLGDPTAEPGTPSYTVADGTSFSTPLVSGYIGLILSQNPGAPFDAVQQAVRGNALDLIDPNGIGENLPGYDVYSGFGRVRMIVPTDLPGGGGPPPPPPPPPNQPPSLDFTGQTGYTTDGVQPDRGNRNTIFKFRVKYSDPEATPASYVRVHVFSPQGIEASNSPFAMNLLSGDPTSGAIYGVNLRGFTRGTWSYHFEGSDGSLTARLPASGRFSGPTIR